MCEPTLKSQKKAMFLLLLLTVEHISPDLQGDFSKELSALFAPVNSLSTIIENCLLFGSLHKYLSMAAPRGHFRVAVRLSFEMSLGAQLL